MNASQINVAFRDFLLSFSKLSTDQSDLEIFLGFPNKAAKPKSKNFIVYSYVSSSTVSRVTDKFDVIRNGDPEQDVGIWSTYNLDYITYTVDVYGRSGRLRLDRLRSLFVSGIAASFFRSRYPNEGSIGIVRLGDVVNLTDHTGLPEYEYRVNCDFTIAAWMIAGVEWDWAEELHITNLKGL